MDGINGGFVFSMFKKKNGFVDLCFVRAVMCRLDHGAVFCWLVVPRYDRKTYIA